MLTQEQIKTYNEEGYVKVEGLFTPEEVEELGSEMVQIIGEMGRGDDWLAGTMARKIPPRR